MDKATVNLSRLACRWNPIPATHDEVISLLVQALPIEENTTSETYQKFCNELTNILGNIESHNPVNHQNMTQKDSSTVIQSIRKIQAHQLVEQFNQIVFLLLSYLPGFTILLNIPTYKATLASHSDYWKFDDMLRMILDCTFEQSQRIEALCEDWHQRGWIAYGIHHSKEALMTCQFDAFEDGKHLHFIDGGDGGYAMAAKGLKLQLKTITA